MRKLILISLLLAVPLRAQLSPASSSTGNITTNASTCATTNACVILHMATSNVGFSVTVSGTWTGTLTVEQSGDNQATWTSVTTTTSNTLFTSVLTPGITDARVRGSAAMTGTAIVTITASGPATIQNITQIGSGTANGFSPPTTGLIGQYDLTVGLTGTTVPDTSGSSNTLTFCGGANAPTWDTAANGGGIIFGSGANNCINLPAGMNGALTFVIYGGFQFSDTGNAVGSGTQTLRTIVGGTSGAATSLGWILYSSTVSDTWGAESQGAYRFRTINTTANNYRGSTFCTFQGNAVMALTLSNPDTFYINGLSCPLLQSGNSVGAQSAGNLTLGATSGGYIGKMYYVLVYSGALNAADVAKATQFERSIVEGKGVIGSNSVTASDTSDMVVAGGDSLTAGILWPVPLLNGVWNVIDQGESGKTAAQITANATTDIYPLFHPGALRNLAINWSGTNAPTPATTVIANHRAFCRGYQILGGKCMVSTMIDRAAQLLNHDNLNDAIRTFGPQYSDFVCDQAANVHLGADGANANSTYFSDTIHLTTFADQNVAGPNFVHCINYTFGNTLQNGKYNTYKGNGVQIPTNRQFTQCNALSGTTTVCAFPWPVLSGSLLFANVTCQSCSGITISSAADSLAQSWTAIGTVGTSGNAKMLPFFFLNSGAGADTLTITYTGGTASNVYITIGEWPGVLAAAALDVNSAVATGTSAAPASANITTTATGDLLLCYSGLALTAAGAPYTAVLSPYIIRSQSANAMQADQLGGVAASYACSATLSSSLTWLAGAAAFKAAAGTSTYTAQDVDIYMECDPSTSNTAINLPDASWMTGYTVTIKNIQTAGANTCVVNGSTPTTTAVAQTIDGAASVTIANKATLVVKSKLTFTGVAGTNLSPLSNWIQLQNN